MATSDGEDSRDALLSLIAAVVAYPWGMWIAEQRGRTTCITIIWLVLDLTPPALACVLGAEVLRQRWTYEGKAVIYATIGLLLGAFWLFIAFNTYPSPLPIRW